MTAAADEGIEIHGYVNCVFAWRVRLVAAEKGVPFTWLPCDIPSPDPRVRAHNPYEHSPLLFQGGFSLLESDVIGAYLDETFPGPSLLSPSARERALLRMLLSKLKAVDVHTEPSRPEARRKTAPALALLEQTLAKGELGEGRQLSGPRDYLHGDAPGFVDLMVLPFLFHSAGRGFVEAGECPSLVRYLDRFASRPSYAATRPPWSRAA